MADSNKAICDGNSGDADCTVGADGCCERCGVSHTPDPCPECGQRAYHLSQCALIGEFI
jgi:hypothetical protein